MSDQQLKYDGLNGLNCLFNLCREKQSKYRVFLNSPPIDYEKLKIIRNELIFLKGQIEKHPNKNQLPEQAVDDLLKVTPSTKKPNMATRK